MSRPEPSDFSIHFVKELTDAQIDEAVAVSIRSFGQAFVVQAITGGNLDLSGLFFRSIIAAGTHSGAVYFATDNVTGRIIGVGVWFGPGRQLYDSAEQRALGLNDLHASLSPETQDWWKDSYGPTVADFLSQVLGKAKVDSWYASLIVTDPAHQRRGVARALIDTVYTKAIVDGTILALCTAEELNSTIYQKTGFKVKGKMEMNSPMGSFPVICLTRE